VILQSCKNIQTGIAGFSSQTWPPTSDDENEVVKIKVEENMHIKEEDEPVLDAAVKVECEVRCESVSPQLDTFHPYPELQTVCMIPICPHYITPQMSRN
jgi:hypothetical protein